MSDILSPEFLRTLLLFMPVFILSLTFHEFAHAWTADKLGDQTARYMGRLTLDPLPHLSLFGTIIFPIMSLAMGAPLFGWMNPVPVDIRNFPKKPFRSMAIVAAAGPASNIFLAILFTAALALMFRMVPEFTQLKRGQGMMAAAVEMFTLAITLNLFLAFFNLIPLPPLDGSRIVQGIVKPQTALWIERMAPQGQIILLILFVFGVLRVMAIPVYAFMSILFALFGIPTSSVFALLG